MIDVGAIVWNCLIWGSAPFSFAMILIRPAVLLDVFPAAYLGWKEASDA